jgi:uncharacterized integral membrane protein
MKLSTRVFIFLVVFVVLSGAVAYASAQPISQSYAQNLNSQVESIPATTIGIFLNNVRIALVEFIPFVGPIFAVYTSYSTGVAIAAISTANSQAQINGLEAFLILMLTPIFWLEFFCYSLAVEESISFIIAIGRKEIASAEWKWLVASILAVVVVLFFSARLEASLVSALT